MKNILMLICLAVLIGCYHPQEDSERHRTEPSGTSKQAAVNQSVKDFVNMTEHGGSYAGRGDAMMIFYSNNCSNLSNADVEYLLSHSASYEARNKILAAWAQMQKVSNQ